jgi:hypothetical protein
MTFAVKASCNRSSMALASRFRFLDPENNASLTIGEPSDEGVNLRVRGDASNIGHPC